MHTDSAILTGRYHTDTASPCQDYCLSGQRHNCGWAVVADGCSTGGQTDFGARIWAMAAQSVLANTEIGNGDCSELRQALLNTASPCLRSLPREDGYATLGILRLREEKLEAVLFGDGALVLRHFDGSLSLINVQYSGNAPAYLNYLLHEDLRNGWVAEFGAQEQIVTRHRFDADGTLIQLRTEVLTPEAPAYAYQGGYANDEIELAIICTDGLATAGKGLFDAALSLAAVKSPAGSFLKRRLSKLARQWQKTDQMPYDDLAVAGIWLGEEMANG